MNNETDGSDDGAQADTFTECGEVDSRLAGLFAIGSAHPNVPGSHLIRIYSKQDEGDSTAFMELTYARGVVEPPELTTRGDPSRRVVLSNDTGAAVLRAMGLEGHPVRRFAIVYQVNAAVEVELTYFVRAGEADGVQREITHFFSPHGFREFTLVPHEEVVERLAIIAGNKPAAAAAAADDTPTGCS